MPDARKVSNTVAPFWMLKRLLSGRIRTGPCRTRVTIARMLRRAKGTPITASAVHIEKAISLPTKAPLSPESPMAA